MAKLIDFGREPTSHGSRILVFVVLAIIVAGIAAFLVLRPNAGSRPENPHAPARRQ